MCILAHVLFAGVCVFGASGLFRGSLHQQQTVIMDSQCIFVVNNLRQRCAFLNVRTGLRVCRFLEIFPGHSVSSDGRLSKSSEHNNVPSLLRTVTAGCTTALPASQTTRRFCAERETRQRGEARQRERERERERETKERCNRREREAER